VVLHHLDCSVHGGLRGRLGDGVSVRLLLVAALLAMAACSGCVTKRNAARVGIPEKGKTRIECKGQNRVVDDPAKCDQKP
jgi:hypothetical protein